MHADVIALMTVPDFAGISVLITESPAASVRFVIDCTGRHRPTLCMSRAQVKHL